MTSDSFFISWEREGELSGAFENGDVTVALEDKLASPMCNIEQGHEGVVPWVVNSIRAKM